MSVIVANAGTLSIGWLRVTTAASRKLGSAAMVGICWSRAILPMPTMAIGTGRSEEHTSELQSLMRISYAVFCLNKKKYQTQITRQLNSPDDTRTETAAHQ